MLNFQFAVRAGQVAEPPDCASIKNSFMSYSAPLPVGARTFYFLAVTTTDFDVNPRRRLDSASRNFVSVNGSKLMSCQRTSP